MGNIFAHLFAPSLDIEVIHAYFHKLPDSIHVLWKRDGGFIIGEIRLSDDSEPIFTQARNSKEFVRMVNDAVYIALNFKPEYIAFFHAQKDIYSPKRIRVRARTS